MHSTSRRFAAVLGALAITVGTTACSSSEPATPSTSAPTSTTAVAAPKAAEIVAQAKAKALAAETAAFSGQVSEDGETMKLDFKGSKDGSTSDITVDLSPNGKVRIISVGGVVYLQGDEAFWKQQDAPVEVQQAGDKFIKAPEEEAGVMGDLTISAFLEDAFSEVTPESISPEVSEESVDGVDCWVVTDKGGKAEGALYVAKDTMELVRFTGSTTSPGQIDFSSWNEDLGVTAPSADQVLDVS